MLDRKVQEITEASQIRRHFFKLYQTHLSTDIIKDQRDIGLLNKIMRNFNLTSAARVNWGKSKAFAVGNWKSGLTVLHQDLQWKNDGMKYQGVYLRSKETVNWRNMNFELGGHLRKHWGQTFKLKVATASHFFQRKSPNFNQSRYIPTVAPSHMLRPTSRATGTDPEKSGGLSTWPARLRHLGCSLFNITSQGQQVWLGEIWPVASWGMQINWGWMMKNFKFKWTSSVLSKCF